MRVRSMILVTVLAILAVSCSGDEADPTTSTTTAAPTSTTATTATPPTSTDPTTTTSTTEVTRVTLAPTDPFVTTGGMGPIRIGMGVEEAAAAAGFELSGEVDPQVSETCYHVTPPADEEAYAGVSFMVVDDVISRVEIGGDSVVTTRSGAGIGISEASLQSMFPGQLESTETTAGGGTGLQFVPHDEEDAEYRVVFLIEDDVVTGYRAGILPAVGYVESCL